MKKIFTFLVIGLPILSASSTNLGEESSQQPITKRTVLEYMHQQIKHASDANSTPDIALVRLALANTTTSQSLHQTAVAALKSVISQPIIANADMQTLEWFELALQPRTDKNLQQIAVNALNDALTATQTTPNSNILRLAFKYSKAGDQLSSTAVKSLTETNLANPNIELLSLAFEYSSSSDTLKTFAINKLTEILNTPITPETIPNPSWVKLALKNIGLCAELHKIAVDHATRVFQMAKPLTPEWCAICHRCFPTMRQ